MKKLLFILTLTQCAVVSYAQSSLRPGYIVTADTIRGAVVYHEGAQATRKCSFTKEGASESTDYSPADIKGYGFESRHFVSVAYRGNLQFMEVIATGAIRLLRGNKVYYLVKDTAFVPLVAERKYTMIKGRRYESEDKIWLGRVKPMLSDCRATAQALDGVQISSFSPRQLEHKFSKLIAQYNECRGEKTTVYKMEKSRRPVSFGFFVGASIPTATFKSLAGSEKYTGAAAPIFGVSLEWANPRVSERLRFRVEVSYSKAKADGTNKYGVYKSVTYSAIKIPLLIHYSFSSGRVAPFIRAGVSGNLPFDARYAMSATGINHESSKFEKFSVPFLVAGGLEAALGKKLHGYIEARYNFPSTVYTDRVLEDKIRVSQMTFRLGVRF